MQQCEKPPKGGSGDERSAQCGKAGRQRARTQHRCTQPRPQLLGSVLTNPLPLAVSQPGVCHSGGVAVVVVNSPTANAPRAVPHQPQSTRPVPDKRAEPLPPRPICSGPAKRARPVPQHLIAQLGLPASLWRGAAMPWQAWDSSSGTLQPPQTKVQSQQIHRTLATTPGELSGAHEQRASTEWGTFHQRQKQREAQQKQQQRPQSQQQQWPQPQQQQQQRPSVQPRQPTPAPVRQAQANKPQPNRSEFVPRWQARRQHPGGRSGAEAPPPAPKTREDERNITIARAGMLGLNEPLGGSQEHEWVRRPTPGQLQLADSLQQHQQQLALHAASRSNGRLETALSHWSRFTQALEGRVQFKPLVGGPGDAANARYNRSTLAMFEDFVRRAPPLGTTKGEHVKAGTAKDYAGAIATYRSITAGYDIAGSDDDPVGPRAAKQMRLEDGPAGDRALSLGVRATDLRKAFPGWPIDTLEGTLEWGVATFLLNVVGRGADAGTVNSRDVPDPRCDLMWSHLIWTAAEHTPDRVPAVTAHIVPSKDTHATKKREPVPISRRSATHPAYSDPVDAYDWILHAWRARSAMVPHASRASTLFWCHADGTPFCSADVASIGKRIAQLAGWPPEAVAQVGAKCFRIGGASDYRDHFGAVEGKELLKRRGRWASDIFHIYSRASLPEQLRASARVGDTEGMDYERVFRGFTQPTTR